MNREYPELGPIIGILRSAQSWQARVQALCSHDDVGDGLVHAAVVQIRPEKEMLPHRLNSADLRYEKKADHGGTLYSFTETRPRSTSWQEVVFSFEVVEPGIGLLLGIAPTISWAATGDAWVDAQYPTLFSPFLRHQDLHSILSAVEQRRGGRVFVRRVQSNRRLDRPVDDSKYETAMRWTNVHFIEEFDRSVRNGEYLRGVDIEIRAKDEAQKERATNRSGLARRWGHFASHRLPELMFAGIDETRKRIIQDRIISRNRGRGVERPAPARPFVAQLTGDAALDATDLQNLVARLRSQRKVSLSVLHGNPYLRATLVDHHDGSAFEIVVASDHLISITPQLRATESAVTRLCQVIYDQIADVEFHDANDMKGAANA